jgi:hypothetical protein
VSRLQPGFAFNIPVHAQHVPERTEGGVILNVLDEVEVAASAACSLDDYLVMPDHSMDARIAAARSALGDTTVMLGHHYQRDEVIRFADFTGDSYKLSWRRAPTCWGATISRSSCPT